MAPIDDEEPTKAHAPQGYTAPVVKREDEAYADEGADYNDEAAGEDQGTAAGNTAKVEPSRALPDYADLVDDADGLGKPKEQDDDYPGPRAEKRPEVVHISGVRRLTRSHLSEVLDAKRLPDFVRLEWIDDDRVCVVFANPEDATKVLKVADAGFDSEVSSPGPGLWRAQRGMLDFREATTADRPDPFFKKQHRGGRQVREFRFWAAMTDMDKRILDNEEATQGSKRPLADGEDEDEKPPKKRAKPAEGDAEESGFDLLEQMATQDKRLIMEEEFAANPAWNQVRTLLLLLAM